MRLVFVSQLSLPEVYTRYKEYIIEEEEEEEEEEDDHLGHVAGNSLLGHVRPVVSRAPGKRKTKWQMSHCLGKWGGNETRRETRL